MAAWFFKQPNGKYGRFSTVVDTVTHRNLTKEQLFNVLIEYYGKYDYTVNHFEEFINSSAYSYLPFRMHTFDEVLKAIQSGNETTESAQELLIDMGFPKEEAEKYYFMECPSEDASEEEWDVYEPFLQKKQ